MDYRPFSIFEHECRSVSDRPQQGEFNFCQFVEQPNLEGMQPMTKVDSSIPNESAVTGTPLTQIGSLKSGLFDSTINSVIHNELNRDPPNHPKPILSNVNLDEEPKKELLTNLNWTLHTPKVTTKGNDETENCENNSVILDDSPHIEIVNIQSRGCDFTHELGTTLYNVDSIILLEVNCKNIFSNISPYNNTIYISDNIYQNNVNRDVQISLRGLVSSNDFANEISNSLNKNLLPEFTEQIYSITKLGTDNLYTLSATEKFYLHPFVLRDHSFLQTTSVLTPYYNINLNIPDHMFLENDLTLTINDKVGNVFTTKTVHIGMNDQDQFRNTKYTESTLKEELKRSLDKCIPESLILKPDSISGTKYEYDVDFINSSSLNFKTCYIRIQETNIIDENSPRSGPFLSKKLFQIHESNILDTIGVISTKVPVKEYKSNVPLDLENWIKKFSIFVNDLKISTIHYNSRDNRDIIHWKEQGLGKHEFSGSHSGLPIYSLSKLNIKITNGEKWDTLYDPQGNTNFYLKFAIRYRDNTNINFNKSEGNLQRPQWVQ
tara:strand:- start:4584 stop:6227 length:1644 start_codon:yes stop_codon:yes gene_type:complete